MILFIVFTGCTKKENYTGTSKVILKYAIFSTPQFASLEKELIADFESKNPDIKVEMRIEPYNAHHQKIQIELAGGTAPDLWLTDGVFIMEWAERGVIEELTELFNSWMKPEEYFGLQALRDPDGKLWGIPKEIQTFGLFYNKDVFDRYGVPYPNESWTWDDLLEAAKALTKDTDGDERIDIYGLGGQSLAANVANMIYQNGGSILDKRRRNSLLETPEAREAIKFVFSLYKQRLMPTIPETSKAFGHELDMFQMGRMAMFWGNYSYVNAIKTTQPLLNYSVAFPPKKVSRHCYYDPNAFVITRGRPSVIKKAAWRYIEYHSGLEAQTKLGREGEGLPFNRTAVTLVVDTEYAKKHNLKVFAEMVEQSVDFDVNGCWRQWIDVFSRELEKGLLGIVPTENVADNAHREVQKVLDSYYSSEN